MRGHMTCLVRTKFPAKTCRYLTKVKPLDWIRTKWIVVQVSGCKLIPSAHLMTQIRCPKKQYIISLPASTAHLSCQFVTQDGVKQRKQPLANLIMHTNSNFSNNSLVQRNLVHCFGLHPWLTVVPQGNKVCASTLSTQQSPPSAISLNHLASTSVVQNLHVSPTAQGLM